MLKLKNYFFKIYGWIIVNICKCILLKWFAWVLHGEVVKQLKPTFFFSKIAKIIFDFIISLNFYHSQKYLMQILPIERRYYFFKH